jgi:uncharacterized protein
VTTPDVKDFLPVSLEHREPLTRFLLEQDVLFCDFSFANLFMWGDLYRITWKLHEGRLWVRNGREDTMLMPVGEPLAPADLQRICAGFRAQGLSGTIALSDDEYRKANPDVEDYFRVEADEANSDYVYLTRKLAELRGNKLSRKRNLISQFRAQFPDAISLPLEPADCRLCLELADKWCRLRNCRNLEGFDPEEVALKRGLCHFDAIGLAGMKLMIGNRMAAFSIWSTLNSETADIHFEKFDPEIKGVAQAINQDTALRLVDRFTHINREQDLGLDGLRRAKLSYYPEYIIHAYSLIPRC